MNVAEIFGQEKCGERMASEEVIQRPVANKREHGSEFVIASASRCGRDELSVFDETRDLDRLPLQPRKISTIAKILRERLNRGEGLLG